MPMSLDQLKGSIPPLITPFKDGEVDYATYERLVERQIVEGPTAFWSTARLPSPRRSPSRNATRPAISR